MTPRPRCRFRLPKQNRKAVLIGKCVGFSDDFMRYHAIRYMDRVGTGRKEAVLYVHGFNNRFTKAAKKMALCGYKMQTDIPLIMFSWPSFQVRVRFLSSL